ncbi:MAG: iron-containing alcohol dehydrogenase [Acidobacteriota bacterium]
MTPFDFRPRTRILFGAGEFARLGEVAREQNATRCLVLAGQAMVDAGHAQEAVRSLKARRMEVFAFHDFTANPTVAMVEAAREYAAPQAVNLVVGLGGGDALDFAKAVNVVISNGGSIRDYRGYGNVPKPLLPMIAVPAVAGPGNEAQSNCAIGDSDDGSKVICGDPKIFFRTAVLDPKLTLGQPAAITAANGYAAIGHAVETLFSTRGTPLSECFSREAWRLLEPGLGRLLRAPEDLEARSAMLLGAHFAGLAVEYAALGPAHACAQPLVKNYKMLQGAALALVLASTLDWMDRGAELVPRLRHLADAADLPTSLRDANVPEEVLPRMAEEAAAQWAGRFSSRPFDAQAALEIYRAAY